MFLSPSSFFFFIKFSYFTRRCAVRDDDEGLIHRGNFKRSRIRKMNFICRRIGQFSRGLNLRTICYYMYKTPFQLDRREMQFARSMEASLKSHYA